MSRKLTGRRRRLVLLCLLLLAAAFGASGNVGTYIGSTLAEGGDKVCLPPKNTNCQQWGCNYKEMCVLSGTDCPATACIYPPMLEE